MIIVKISGGLGNQLFQYYFGQYLSQKLNTKVLYDIQTIKSISNFTPRALDLSLLNFPLEIASKKDKRKINCFTSGVLDRIARKIAKKTPFLFNKYFVESSLHGTIHYNKLKDNCYYDGYWQSYKYLDPAKTIFLNANNLITSLTEGKTTLINQILNYPSISIHIRRGDYITVQKNFEYFGVCNKKYYEEAILYIIEKVNNPIFYMFTDDLDWAKENFIGSQYIFITGNNPVEDLYLMSKCKHNIIANSTFSWWGAWLNLNKDKIVIAPKKWYKGKLNSVTTDLIPSSWIQL